jgi:hypothetical protein
VSGRASTTTVPPAGPRARVRIFVDFWNFHLTLKHWNKGADFQLDWSRLGPWLTKNAGVLALPSDQSRKASYEGLHVYMSFDPRRPRTTG